jgi:hypothetical protein
LSDRCFFDQFIQFAPVQPNASAIRAIVDFDTLSFRHDKCGVFALWAFHGFQSLRVCVLIFQHYSLELPKPNKLSKLVNKLKMETNKLTVART